MPPYLRLCDVTQPKLNMQNQIIKDFQEYFDADFYRYLILVTSNQFPQKIFFETSLNIQNGGVHSTNVQIFSCP